MVRTAGAETLGAGVYDHLRTDVLGGRYQPGERLRPVDLATEYAVGAGVVREALTRLAEQRLLVAEPNRGYRVMTVSAEQISELVELRRVSECAALRLSVERGDLAWEGRVLAAHHHVASLGPDHDRDVWALAHKDFHQTLISGCGNDRLVALCEELFLESELYRRWSGEVLARETHAHDARRERSDEHLALRNAALTRDADRAVALHEEHLRRTADLALTFAAGLDASAATTPVDRSA
jgi:DNA-binding GntR family transcriptional regulator